MGVVKRAWLGTAADCQLEPAENDKQYWLPRAWNLVLAGPGPYQSLTLHCILPCAAAACPADRVAPCALATAPSLVTGGQKLAPLRPLPEIPLPPTAAAELTGRLTACHSAVPAVGVSRAREGGGSEQSKGVSERAHGVY